MRNGKGNVTIRFSTPDQTDNIYVHFNSYVNRVGGGGENAALNIRMFAGRIVRKFFACPSKLDPSPCLYVVIYLFVNS